MKFSKQQLSAFWINCLVSSIILALFSLIYLNFPYYQTFLSEQTRSVIASSVLPAFILVLAFQFWRLVFNFDSEAKSQTIYYFFEKVFFNIFNPKRPKGWLKTVFTFEVKTALLSYVVKFFFFPIMLNTVMVNGSVLRETFRMLISGDFVLDFAFFYNNSRTLIFFIDTLFFAFGYAVESGIFRSKIKSVEPTFFGWFIALCTYPPFNTTTGSFFPLPQGGTSIYTEGIWSMFGLSAKVLEDNFVVIKAVTIVLRVLILLLFTIYVWATLALGAKSSNLTNRGIVAKGPYAIVRHPAYIAKNLAWWLEGILAATNPVYFASMLVWNLIYFLRAWTEERHLGADPDYQAYKKQVKWMFIPGVV